MQLVKKETCLEYFKRRLSEGWKCISYKFPHVVLLSPTGFRREIDLRKDVLTLRPNAAGAEENITNSTSGVGNHWQDVDETPPDDMTTKVWKGDTPYLRDLYDIPNHTTETGTINKITVYARCRGDGWP